jgi:hypothetical protein
MEKLFSLGDYSIACGTKGTRNGFKHEAIFYNKGGYRLGKVNCKYYNRSYERFTYEDVLKKAVNTFLEGIEQEKVLQLINELN